MELQETPVNNVIPHCAQQNEVDKDTTITRSSNN